MVSVPDASMTVISRPAADAKWWRDAVVYQVYLRSFADANGDGIGDLTGLRSRLPYLAWLGVDALWLTPHYPSGGADGGYDVSDYRNVDPDFGSTDDVRLLVEDAHALGLRVLLDVVPNHTSAKHAWFQSALADPTGPETLRYHFVDVDPDHPEQRPNNWVSLFGGPAWSKTPDGRRWFLHLFAPEQPDLNWRDPMVGDDFEATLRFWLDMGVDGFRVDVAYGLFKDPDLRDNPGTYSPTLFGHGPEQAMTWNQPEVHDVWRRWRAVCDSYDGDRMLVGEVCLADLDEVALYARPDEMHQSFTFRLIKSGWDAAAFAEAIETALTSLGAVGAPVSWVLGNHDKDRQVTRFGGGTQGLARARAATLLLLSLPGSAYLYAGDELGLPQAVVPDAQKQDPIFFHSGGARPGRDGCRIPMPWNTATGVGFSPDGSDAPWLPVPTGWADYAASTQIADPTSTLMLYRDALQVRRTHDTFGLGRGRVTQCGDLIRVHLTGHSGAQSTCWLNMGTQTALIPATGDVLLASGSGTYRVHDLLALPMDTAVWMSA